MLNKVKEQARRELNWWLENRDQHPTIHNTEPKGITEYPKMMAVAEKMRQIIRFELETLSDAMKVIEDSYMEVIEQEQILVKKGTISQLPQFKKKFSSKEMRERELRKRLADNGEYQDLKEQQLVWKSAAGDWREHAQRLHREWELLKVEWQSAGGSGTGL